MKRGTHFLCPDPWYSTWLPSLEKSTEDRLEEPRLEPQLDTLPAAIDDNRVRGFGNFSILKGSTVRTHAQKNSSKLLHSLNKLYWTCVQTVDPFQNCKNLEMPCTCIWVKGLSLSEPRVIKMLPTWGGPRSSFWLCIWAKRALLYCALSEKCPVTIVTAHCTSINRERYSAITY